MSSDRNSGAPARPGGFLLPFWNGRFAIYRGDFTPRVSMQEAGFELILRDVVGKAQVYLDGKLVAEKADPDKKTLTIPVPAGEGLRIVSSLIESPAVGLAAGVGGTVTLESRL